jgi:hypothetical protein
MRLFTLVLLVSLFLAFEAANALTVDEIIKLKQGGVSDETIQLLIRRDSDYRLSGTWKTKDGWIIHSTEMGGHRKSVDPAYQNSYPIDVYPQVFSRHR